MKNESAEALHTSQTSNAMKLDTIFRPQKLIFLWKFENYRSLTFVRGHLFFEVEISVSGFILFEVWAYVKPLHFHFPPWKSQKCEELAGASRPRPFTSELSRRATTDQMSAQECSEAWNLRTFRPVVQPESTDSPRSA